MSMNLQMPKMDTVKINLIGPQASGKTVIVNKILECLNAKNIKSVEVKSLGSFNKQTKAECEIFGKMTLLVIDEVCV